MKKVETPREFREVFQLCFVVSRNGAFAFAPEISRATTYLIKRALFILKI